MKHLTRIIALCAGLLAGMCNSPAFSVDNTAALQLIGTIESIDTKNRQIQFGGEYYSVPASVKITDEEGRVRDPMLLPVNQPIGIAWTTSGGRKIIRHIHVFNELPQ